MLIRELFTGERVQPCFIEPTLVAAVRELPDGGAWTYEAKLDGYRCLAAQARRSCCALVAPKKRLHSTVPVETDRCPFANLPEARRYRWDVGLTLSDMENCSWRRPKLVAQIEFNESTPDGHLRHSSFAGLRDDKDPRLIVRE
jgi:ATP-dependent DNA ligase